MLSFHRVLIYNTLFSTGTVTKVVNFSWVNSKDNLN